MKKNTMDEIASGHAFIRPKESIELRDETGTSFYVDQMALDMRVDRKKVWTAGDLQLYIEIFPSGTAERREVMRLDRFILESFEVEINTQRRIVHLDGNTRNCMVSNLAMVSGRSKEASNAA